MAKRLRAQEIRRALTEIMNGSGFLEELGGSSISRCAVQLLKERRADLIEENADELIDIGLMHTAGSTKSSASLTASNDNITDQYPLFSIVGNNESRTSDITPRQFYESQNSDKKKPDDRRVNKPKTKIQKLNELMSEMRDKGLDDMTVGEYLATK